MGLIAGIESRAELFPRLGNGVECRNVLGIFGEDDGKACLQMPVDVAVQEPRARVVGSKPNCYLSKYDGYINFRDKERLWMTILTL